MKQDDYNYNSNNNRTPASISPRTATTTTSPRDKSSSSPPSSSATSSRSVVNHNSNSSSSGGSSCSSSSRRTSNNNHHDLAINVVANVAAPPALAPDNVIENDEDGCLPLISRVVVVGGGGKEEGEGDDNTDGNKSTTTSQQQPSSSPLLPLQPPTLLQLILLKWCYNFIHNNNNTDDISTTSSTTSPPPLLQLLLPPVVPLPLLRLVHCDNNNSSNQRGGGDGGRTNNYNDIINNSNSSPPPPPDPTKLTNNEKVLTSLVAGASAGAIAKTVIAPLDRTKIFFQTTPSTHFNLHQVLRYLYKTYKSTGFTSLWRGNSATMARIIPYAAIQFTAHEQWKHVFKVDSHVHKGPSASSELTRFLCGSLAGITAQSLTYPLDLTRARLAVSPISKYTGLGDVFVKTVRGEGVRGLFKGYVPTMMGVVPYAGCSFYCYEGLKRLWVREFGEGSVGGWERLCFGAVAGVVGQSCSYPFDIVRRRLQTDSSSGGSSKQSTTHVGGGALKTFRMMSEIGRTEGIIRGLYKGLSMNWVKGPVAAGISFACYDWAQGVLREEVVKVNRRLGIGGIGGGMGGDSSGSGGGK